MFFLRKPLEVKSIIKRRVRMSDILTMMKKELEEILETLKTSDVVIWDTRNNNIGKFILEDYLKNHQSQEVSLVMCAGDFSVNEVLKASEKDHIAIINLISGRRFQVERMMDILLKRGEFALIDKKYVSHPDLKIIVATKEEWFLSEMKRNHPDIPYVEKDRRIA